MLLLQLRQHLRKLALQDLFVRDQLRPPAAGRDRLEIRRQPVVVVRERAPHLERTEQILPRQRPRDAVEQRGAHRVHVAAGRGVAVLRIRRQRLDDRQVRGPPRLQRLHERLVPLAHPRVPVHLPRDGPQVRQRRTEIGIGRTVRHRRPWHEAALAQARIVRPEPPHRPGVDLRQRHPAVQMRPHVMRLRRRRVVHIAADVAVVALFLDLAHWHPPCIARNVPARPVGMHHLVDVLRPQVVLRLALAVLAVGVDEQHRVARRVPRLVQHQDARRNARAVEQVARQPDHRLQVAFLDEVLARLLLLAAPEQHAVRHHRRQPPARLQHRQHVLHEHQVRLLALLRHPDRKAPGELDVLLQVVLAERRIGQHAVEAQKLPLLVLVLRLAQGVLLADHRVRDAVQQHVHLADGPRRAHLLLPVQRQLRRIGPALAQVVARLDQHAARAHRRVVHAHALTGIADLDADPHHLGRGVELARLLARRVGKVLDQPLVGRTEQVRELEVRIAQRDLLEVLDEVDQRVVVERVLADLLVEVDVLEHILQRVRIGFFQRFERLVQGRADVLLDMLEGRVVLALVVGPALVPARPGRHEEILAGVLVRVFQAVVDVFLAGLLCRTLLADLGAALVEQVAGPLQEQHAEDVFLVLAGVHVAAQVVAGGQEQAFEASEGQARG